jgi:hypothetical protein
MCGAKENLPLLQKQVADEALHEYDLRNQWVCQGLVCAARHNCVDIAAWLLETFSAWFQPQEGACEWEEAAVQEAVKHGSLDVLMFLDSRNVARGGLDFDMDGRASEIYESLWRTACENKQVEVARWLLSVRVSDRVCRSFFGHTGEVEDAFRLCDKDLVRRVMHVHLQFARTDMYNGFIDRRLDVLLAACASGSLDMVLWFLETWPLPPHGPALLELAAGVPPAHFFFFQAVFWSQYTSAFAGSRVPLLKWLVNDLGLEVTDCFFSAVRDAHVDEIMYMFEAASDPVKRLWFEASVRNDRVDVLKRIWPPVVHTVDDVFSLAITGLSWNVLQWLMDTHPSHVDEWRTKLPSELECNVHPTCMSWNKWLMMNARHPAEVVRASLRRQTQRPADAWNELPFVEWVWSLGVLTADDLRSIYRQLECSSLDVVLWLVDAVFGGNPSDADLALLQDMLAGVIRYTLKRGLFDLYFAVDLYRARTTRSTLEPATPQLTTTQLGLKLRVRNLAIGRVICTAWLIASSLLDENKWIPDEVRLRVNKFREIIDAGGRGSGGVGRDVASLK